MWGRSRTDAEALAKDLPSSIENKEPLQALIRAIPIERVMDLEPMARRLREISDEAPWLADEIANHPTSWESDLAILSPPQDAHQDLPDWKGLTGDLPLYSALMGRPNPSMEAETLRAVLLCGLIRAGFDEESPLRKSHIVTIATAIRGIDRDPEHYYRPAMAMLADAQSAPEASVMLLRALPQDSELREQWVRVWHPIIAEGASRKKAPRKRRKATDDRSPLHGVRTPLPPIAFTVIDQIPGEAPEDYGAIDEAIRTRIRQPRETIRQQQRTDLYRSRAENHSLLPDHIEVLSTQEFATLRDTLLIAVEKGRYWVDRARAALLLTQAALSIDIEQLAATPIVDQHSECPDKPSISIKLGTYWQPTPRLPNQHVPSEQELMAYESTAPGFALPLPPTVTRALHSARIDRGTTLGSSIRDTDVAKACQAFLFTLGVPMEARRLSRLRRLAAVHVMDAGNDFPAVQMAFGDSFGRSNGHLYYTSFGVQRLRDLYTRGVWPLFGDDPPQEQVTPQPLGCGPAYAPRQDVVREGFRFLLASLNRRPDLETAPIDVIARWHNRYTQYCAFMLAAGSGHRPVDALYKMRLSQIDWYAGYIVAKDKQVDISHTTRPAAMARVCAEQLQHYVTHLMAIAGSSRIPKRVREHIQQALASETPIWVFLRESGARPRRGSMNDYQGCWPAAWQPLPSNWYRHYLATNLRRDGAQPIYVQIQLGHLGSSGQPLAEDSPISPLHVVTGIRHALDEVAAGMGLRAREGYADPRNAKFYEPPPADWSPAIAEHSRIGNRVRKATELKRKAESRSAQRRVASRLGPVLARHSSELAHAHGIWAAQTMDDSRTSDRVFVNDSVVEAIIEDIEAQTHETPIDRLALLMMLRELLRDCQERMGMKVPRIGTTIKAAGGDLAPMLADTAVATRYIHQLRSFLRDSAKEGLTIAPAARTTLATLAYELPRSADALHRMVCVEKDWHRPDSKTLLRIAGAADQEATAVSGLASISYRIAGNERIVSITELNDLVADSLPAALRPVSRERTLEIMVSVASVAARYEQSGLVRLARDTKDGSVLPDTQTLTAFLHGEATPATGKRLASEPSPTGRARAFRTPKQTELREQYKRLRLALTHPDHIVSGKPISASDQAHTRPPRPRVIAAVDQVISEVGPMVTITHALAKYVHEMLVDGTPRTSNPAISTIETYLSEIGTRLINKLHGSDMQAVSPGELEDAYLEIVESRVDREGEDLDKATSAGRRCAQQLIQFQNVLEEMGGPSVDLSILGPYMSRADRRRYWTLVSNAEYEAAKTWLYRAFEGSCEPDVLGGNWRTLCRHAVVAMMLIYRSGARINEISWLRLSDIHSEGDEIALTIRPTRYRGLKTRAARRRISIGDRMTQDEKILLAAWLADQRAGRDHISAHKIFAFSPPESHRHVIGDATLRAYMRRAHDAAGAASFFPHSLRHSHVSERFRDLIGRPTDSASAPRIARELQRQVHETGHARLSTGVRHYCHVPLPVALPSAETTGRWHLAAVADKKVQAVDLAGTRHASAAATSEQRLYRWSLAVDTSYQTLPTAESPIQRAIPGPLPPEFQPYTIADLDHLMRELRATSSAQGIAARYGLRNQDWEQLKAAVSDLADRCNYRMLGLETGRAPTPVPRRKEGISNARDWAQLPIKELHRMGLLFAELYRPFHARLDELRGNEGPLGEMARLFRAHGLRPAPKLDAPGVGSFLRLSFPTDEATTGHSLVCWHLGLAYLHSRLTCP